MFFLCRVAVVVIAFLVKLGGRIRNPQVNYPPENPRFHLETHSSKGKVINYTLLIPCQSDVVFKFTLENFIDRFWKAMGVAGEIQSGDEAFDRKVYVASDHPGMAQALRDSRSMRLAIRGTLQEGYRNICSDGRFIWIKTRDDQIPTSDHREYLATIAGELQKVVATLPNQFSDPFIWRVLVVEAFIWSLASYAIGAALEWMLYLYVDLHVYPSQLITSALLAALVITPVLFFMIQLFLFKSSRAHRILVESVIVLGLSVPLSVIELFSDLNTQLDVQDPIKIERSVVSKKTIIHRGRRGSKTPEYILNLSQATINGKQNLPTKVLVTRDRYNSVTEGETFTMRIKPGFLGFLWYQ